MIENPAHLVGFFKVARSGEEASSAVKIHPSERGPLSYIAEYIVSKMHKNPETEGTHAAKNYRH